MQHGHAPFTNPAAVASYAENAQRNVPGLHDLHRMVTLLLAEPGMPATDILVVGAGGGMEILAMAEARPDWRFTGVDPSLAMLDLARRTLQPHAHRIDLLEGTIDQAPAGPFDGATCLLTMHHLDRSQRLHTLRETRRRLKPGARLITVEHTAASLDPERWIARSIAFSDKAGPDWEMAAISARKMTEHLSLLTPQQEEDLLREAGFDNIALFYAAFSFRGWVSTARA